MTSAIGLDELLAWSQECSGFWKGHFDANPALLELPCSIDGAGTVQGLVRHIWVADLRWAQRIGGLPLQAREDLPAGPLEALFGLHQQAAVVFKRLLDDPAQDWETVLALDYAWLPPQLRSASRRKLMAHALLHSQRHWAQLATLLRAAGFPTGFRGDMIFSAALD
jgi:uncharacterized damage-inducible protein DinB